MSPRAFVTGLNGKVLTEVERDFLRQADPWGVILFRRNVEAPDQVRRLTASVRELVGREVPILVDQEGGRVQRLGPPHWPAYPAAGHYGAIYRRDPGRGLAAARLGARLIAADLWPLGISIDCLPVADLPVEGADAVIGDRAYGATPEEVAVLAMAAADGLHEGGILPVLKHIPGHGRATVDSHAGLPTVSTDRDTLERTDFAPFRALRALPLGMTAHVVFAALDPVAPATNSVTIVRDVIRGTIGFGGALMSDDISMAALAGTMAERAGAALGAGCDLVLHCNGRIDEMRAVAGATPQLTGEALRRTSAALASQRVPGPIEIESARAEWSRLCADLDAAHAQVSSV